MKAKYLQVVILLISSLAASQADPKLVAAIDDIANQALAQGPIAGTSIAVRRGQQIILLKGYGNSSLELETSTTAKTLYHMLLYAESDTAAQKGYERLNGASDKFLVYRRKDLPKNLHYDENDRVGDSVIIPKGSYAIRAHASNPADTVPKIKGGHGYDPEHMRTMRAIFYAAGPDIYPGSTVDPFENVNIFPLIVRILGLDAVPNDGDAKVLEGILQPHRKEPVRKK